MTLSWSSSGAAKAQVISFVSLSMRFGGVRWWALCPVTGRKCGTLVYASRYGKWVSVRASGFAYRTQNLDTLDRLAALRDKRQEKCRKLSKYARTATKDRVRERWLEAEEAWDNMFENYAAVLFSKIRQLELKIGKVMR